MAFILDVHRTLVDAVCRAEKDVPPSWCPIVERITTGGIPAHELRADLAWVRVPCSEWPHAAGRPVLDEVGSVAIGRALARADEVVDCVS